MSCNDKIIIEITEINDIVNLEIEENCESVILVIEDVGIKGENGKSAYQIALSNGFIGTEQEWLESLKGEVLWQSANW